MLQRTYTYELKIFNAIFFSCFAMFLICFTDLTYGWLK